MGLDAARDEIEKHLGYTMDQANGVYRETLTSQGVTTVEHAKLNRLPLRNRRRGIWISTKDAIDRIKEKQSQGDARAHTAIQILKDKFSQEDGSLLKYLCDTNGINYNDPK